MSKWTFALKTCKKCLTKLVKNQNKKPKILTAWYFMTPKESYGNLKSAIPPVLSRTDTKSTRRPSVLCNNPQTKVMYKGIYKYKKFEL